MKTHTEHTSTVKISPITQLKIERMRREHSDRNMERAFELAVNAMDRCNRLIAENVRLRDQNQRLQIRLHEAMGWPNMPQISYAEVMP